MLKNDGVYTILWMRSYLGRRKFSLQTPITKILLQNVIIGKSDSLKFVKLVTRKNLHEKLSFGQLEDNYGAAIEMMSLNLNFLVVYIVFYCFQMKDHSLTSLSSMFQILVINYCTEILLIFSIS